MESIYRRPCRGGIEVDAFSKTHGGLCWRPGERKAIKARANRRSRRSARRELRSAGAPS